MNGLRASLGMRSKLPAWQQHLRLVSAVALPFLVLWGGLRLYCIVVQREYEFPNVVASYGLMKASPVHFSNNATMRKVPIESEVAVYNNEDWTFPNDFEPSAVAELYTRAYIVYAQNLNRSALTVEQSKRTYWIPIGLDLHSGAPLAHTSPTNRWIGLKRYLGGSGFSWGVTGSPAKQWSRLLLTRWTHQNARRSGLNPTGTPPTHSLVTWRPHSRHGDLRWGVRKQSGYHPELGPDLTPFRRHDLYEQAMKRGAKLVLGNRQDQHDAVASATWIYSPFGNGLDCHRTWEALVLGAIPVLLHQPLEGEMLAHDLPVKFVGSFAENLGKPPAPMDAADPRLSRTYWLSQHNRDTLPRGYTHQLSLDYVSKFRVP